jgi:hypothetical protein
MTGAAVSNTLTPESGPFIWRMSRTAMTSIALD